MLEKVLGNMGAPIKAWKIMYKAVVQMVIMYGIEIWVFTDVMMAVLEGFHHRISIRIEGMMARRGNGGEWGWSSVDAETEVTGL